MTAAEAWTVTGLGMAVTFLGLAICIGFIRLFGVIARHVGDGEPHGAAPHGAAPPQVAALAAPEAPPPAEPVPAPVLAVIAAVLDIERALYMNRPGSRVTIRRTAPRP
jgi:Na+-transporting methylmalonyl-CoA/oxaloacetate decarboxylase gamma subunit